MPSVDSTGRSISFERWINGMTDNEYEDMLDESNPNGFSDAQQEKALNIRTPPTKEELEDLELEQEFEETPVPRREPITFGERVTEETGVSMVEPTQQIPPSQPTVTPPITQPKVEPPKPPKRVEQVKRAVQSAVQSTGKFLRRFFRV